MKVRTIRTWAVLTPAGNVFVNSNRKATNHTATKAHASYLADTSRHFGQPPNRAVRVLIKVVEP